MVLEILQEQLDAVFVNAPLSGVQQRNLEASTWVWLVFAIKRFRLSRLYLSVSWSLRWDGNVVPHLHVQRSFGLQS
jgi:hypothetical protein